MRVAIAAALLFSIAFFSHWLVWRVRIPQRQTAALLLIMLGVLPVGLTVLVLIAPMRLMGHWHVWECVHIAVFHIAMTLAYIVAYSALEERSPSMTVLSFVANSGGKGRAEGEILALFKHGPVEIRIAAMVRDGMMTDADGHYRLTSKGLAWARLFGAWRKIVNLPLGG